ncbi:MAG: hypothetical protein ACOC8X_03565 [Chloroflexota bacterium]
MTDITTFVAGLEALEPSGITMLNDEPTAPPPDNELSVAWVALPTIIGQPPTTVINSSVRPIRFRALILVAVAYARQDEQKERFGALVAAAQDLQAALDGADIGFRLSYEIAIDRTVKIGGDSFFGLAAIVTGER